MLEGWTNICVGDICKISTGTRNTQDNTKNGKYPFFVRSDKVERINTYSYDGEAVLTAGDGVGVGKVVHYINGKFDYHQRVYKMSDFHEVEGKYFYYYFKKFFYNRVKSMSAKNSVDSVRLDMIKDMNMYIPEKIEEQKSIVNILNNIDNLINFIQKTIKKKEMIFETATQELLSGKNKKYKWKKVTLGEIGDFAGNGVDKKIKEDEQKIRLLNYMDIMRKNFIYKNISKHYVTASEEKIRKCLVKKGDIFLTPSSETRTDIGVSSVAMEDIDDLVYSYHIIRFRPRIEMDLLFRAYIFKNKNFLSQASILCEGSGKRYVCSNKKFESIEIYIPMDPREQKDIADKLYGMEIELNKLNEKLKKYKLIKEGMMEDLLTGKVRLNYE